MKQPTVPTLTGEEQYAIHVVKMMVLFGGGGYVTSKDAYDSYLAMDDKTRAELWESWHNLHLNCQN